jgi:hypothetical protein
MFEAAKISSPALRTGSAILICRLRAISSWVESDVLGIRPLRKIGTRVVRGENQAHTISGRSCECDGGTEAAERKGCEGLEGLGDSDFLRVFGLRSHSIGAPTQQLPSHGRVPKARGFCPARLQSWIDWELSAWPEITITIGALRKTLCTREVPLNVPGFVDRNDIVYGTNLYVGIGKIAVELRCCHYSFG